MEGQIYIPVVNYALLALCLTIVLAFRTSSTVADAYGIAVLLDMLVTTILATLVMISVWRVPLMLAAAFFIVFSVVEGVLWSSTLRKVVGYGWMAVIMAVMWGGVMAGEFFVLLCVWWGCAQRAHDSSTPSTTHHQPLSAMCLLVHGQGVCAALPTSTAPPFFPVWSAGTAARRKSISAPPLATLLDAASAGEYVAEGSSLTVPIVPLRHTNGAKGRIARARGVALFYSDRLDSAPPVLAHLLTRMPVLFQVQIFLTNRFVPLPEVDPKERLLARDAGVEGFFHVVAR